MDTQGKPATTLQSSAAVELGFPLDRGDDRLWLVLVARPNKQQSSAWDQVYYSLDRYPCEPCLGGAVLVKAASVTESLKRPSPVPQTSMAAGL